MVIKLPWDLIDYVDNFLLCKDTNNLYISYKVFKGFKGKYILDKFIQEINHSNILTKFIYMTKLNKFYPFLKSSFHVIPSDINNIKEQSYIEFNNNPIYSSLYTFNIKSNSKITFHFYDDLGCLLGNYAEIDKLIKIVHINIFNNGCMSQFILKKTSVSNFGDYENLSISTFGNYSQWDNSRFIVGVS